MKLSWTFLFVFFAALLTGCSSSSKPIHIFSEADVQPVRSVDRQELVGSYGLPDPFWRLSFQLRADGTFSHYVHGDEATERNGKMVFEGTKATGRWNLLPPVTIVMESEQFTAKSVEFIVVRSGSTLGFHQVTDTNQFSYYPLGPHTYLKSNNTPIPPQKN